MLAGEATRTLARATRTATASGRTRPRFGASRGGAPALRRRRCQRCGAIASI
jgi:hypothetical protein